MDDMMKRQNEEDEKSRKEKLSARLEYDAVIDGLSAVKFHMNLFLLLWQP